MAEVTIQFSGLTNTFDRELIEQKGFAMSNVDLRHGILETEPGFIEQIPSPGIGTVYGSWFAREDEIEEYGMVHEGVVYTAIGAGSTQWIGIFTGAANEQWHFQNFAGVVYGISKTSGLIKHGVGTTQWTESGTDAPGPSDEMSPIEWQFRNLEDVGIGNTLQNSIVDKLQEPGQWDVTLIHDTVPVLPELVDTVGNKWLFDMNRNYRTKPDGLQFTGTFDELIDFSRQDEWKNIISLQSSNAGGTNFKTQENDITMFFETEDGTNIYPDFTSELVEEREGTSIVKATRTYYFNAQRDLRVNIKKIHYVIYFHSPGGIREDAQMHIDSRVGDVYINDSEAIDLKAGPIRDSINYRYSRTTSGQLESNLSEVTSSSGVVPTEEGFPSLQMRVGINTVGLGTTGDVYTLYRQRKSDSNFVSIGSTTYLGAGVSEFNSENLFGDFFVTDNFLEADLPGLPLYDGLVIDDQTSPTAIGAHRSSLCLGIGKNIHISFTNQPEHFVGLDEVPDTNRESAGRSMYVDESQSENVIMVQGTNILYLGTRSNTYVVLGDKPNEFSTPRAVSNRGPIGGRAHTKFQQGVAILNEDGVFVINPTIASENNNNEGAINSIELTQDLENTIDNLGIGTLSVLAQHRGDLWAFAGSNYLRLDRKTSHWTEGDLPINVTNALPDRSLDMRLVSSTGQLIHWGIGTDHDGTDIAWSYTTGDIRFNNSRLTDVVAICEGSPTVRVESFYGDRDNNDITFTLNEANDHIQDFFSGRSHGNRYRFTISGNSNNDKLKKLQVEFTITGESQDN